MSCKNTKGMKLQQSMDSKQVNFIITILVLLKHDDI